MNNKEKQEPISDEELIAFLKEYLAGGEDISGYHGNAAFDTACQRDYIRNMKDGAVGSEKKFRVTATGKDFAGI